MKEKLKLINHRHTTSLVVGIMTLLFLGILLAPYFGFAQQSSHDFERFQLSDDVKHIFVGLDAHPTNGTVAVSGIQGYPLYIFDPNKKEVLKEYNVGNWYAGSRVRYSPDGKYVLLQQLHYIDWAMNKDKEVNFELIDAETGKRIKRFDNFHAVSFSSDGEQVIALSGDDVYLYETATAKKVNSFHVPAATNAVVISPDMKYIAVSHKMDAKELRDHPAIRNKKKNKKIAKKSAKFKQFVSIYDARTFKKLKTVGDIYDIIYRLEYSPDGKYIFVMHIPHAKAQTGVQRQTYISMIETENNSAIRHGFMSKALYEPDFKLSNDGRLFGIVSHGNRFVEIHVYDFFTGKMVNRFEQSYRLFEKSEGKMVAADSRSSFVFLPGDEEILMTMGNRLIKWNLNSNK